MSDEQTPTPDDEREAPASEQPEATPAAADDEGVEATSSPDEPVSDAPAGDEQPAEAPAAEEPTTAPTPAAAQASDDDVLEDDAPRAKPAIPGADLEVDIVREGDDVLSQYDEDADPDGEGGSDDDEDDFDQPIAAAEINLAADARYRATGKRKTAVARVTLKPGDGSYVINGRTLDEFFPRPTLQRTIRQPLEAVALETRMDVIATMHGGGVSAQAGALRHGISRALLEADPNLRGELKKRGYLTRDARAKERKKAGLKKARKKPQFSKR